MNAPTGKESHPNFTRWVQKINYILPSTNFHTSLMTRFNEWKVIRLQVDSAFWQQTVVQLTYTLQRSNVPIFAPAQNLSSLTWFRHSILWLKIVWPQAGVPFKGDDFAPPSISLEVSCKSMPAPPNKHCPFLRSFDHVKCLGFWKFTFVHKIGDNSTRHD